MSLASEVRPVSLYLLPVALTLPYLSDFKKDILEMNGANLLLDAGRVVDVDVAGLQVLLAAQLYVGMPLQWQNVPVFLRETAERVGLADLLQLLSLG